MCDPVSLSIASTVVGVAGSAMTAMGQMSAQKKQQDAVNSWQIKQKQFRDQEKVRQEKFRDQSTAAREAGLNALAPDAQQQQQEDEANRLGQYFAGDEPAAEGQAPTSVADNAMLAGQELAPSSFQSDLARKIAETTGDARNRMAALARVASYGGSRGSGAVANAIAQGRTGQEIDKVNAQREGSLGAFGIEKAIDPLQVSYTPSPLAGLFSTALSFGAQGMGNMFGKPSLGADAGPWGATIPTAGSDLTTFPAAPGGAFPATTNILPRARPII